MEAVKIQFGENTYWELPGGAGIASISPPLTAIEDISKAIDSALSNPLDFPPLDQALVPGDQLVLAVDPALPALVEVVASIAQWFCEHGTPASNIRIVLAGEGGWNADDLAAAIATRTQHSIAVVQHDFDDPERIAYVAANEASDPIYLNRWLVDADVVIPISCPRPQSALDYFGAFGLFPLLSNRATRGEFYSLPKIDESLAHAQLNSWAQQAAWWLGVMVGIQVVPAGRNRVSMILAGQLDALEIAAQQAMSEHWNTPNDNSDLVVAILDGPSDAQSWTSVARTLALAMRCVRANGTIVLATQLDQAIGRGLSRLRDPHQTPQAIAKKLAADASDDALAAAVILRATASNHVYLISELKHESVESLGLGVIANGEQLTRLLQRHNSCTIIEAAQHRSLELCQS